MNYEADAWWPGGHLQTIGAALWARRTAGPAPRYRRERWATPDADFVDVDWLVPAAPSVTGHAGTARTTTLVLFHGLEGSSRSHYAESFAAYAAERGWSYAVPHFRGCSGELNHAPRAYHSGDFVEIGWMLGQVRARIDRAGGGRLLAVGVSLGGNALLRWAGESGSRARDVVQAIAAVCAPVDLAAGGWAIGRGFNRQVYNRMFLQTMKPKALTKLKQHPGLFDAQALVRAKDLYAFDQIFTAPLHGFHSTEDYWARASSKPMLASIRLPALVLNARNDPFIPAWSLPTAASVSKDVTLWQPEHGGHVGFPAGVWPGHVRGLPARVGAWLDASATG